MNEALSKLVESYRDLPEFMFIEELDVNTKGMTGDTLLHVAVIRECEKDVDVLMKAGANVNATGDLGNTPLHHAASRGLAHIAAKLIKHGAKRDAKNEFGQTPADLAVLMRHEPLARILH